MKLSKLSKINNETIEYINSKTSNNYSLAHIIREELGNDTPKKEIDNKRKNLSKKLSIAGYKFNKDKKIYELNNNIKDELLSNESSNVSDVSNNEVSNFKPKRQYIKKSEKAYLENLKDNPLYYEIDLYGLIANIDYIHKEIQLNPKKIGVRLHQNIVDLFKVIEERHGYFDFYLLVNNATYSCYKHSKNLKTSHWLIEYSNFISENTINTKKQVNLTSCEAVYDMITMIQNDFPILDRSEIVNFSLYIYTHCFIKKINGENK